MVGCLHAGLHRAERRACRPKGTDHLHLAIGAFRFADDRARLDRACRRLGVDRVGLSGSTQIPTLGTEHLENPDPFGS